MSEAKTREQVLALQKRGLSYTQIANALGISRGTVGGHISRSRSGVPAGRWSSEQIDALMRMHGEGATSRQIGAVVKKKADAVRKQGIRLGLSWVDRVPRSGLAFTVPALTEKQTEEAQREGDERLVRALALSFQRGDHLPQAMREAA